MSTQGSDHLLNQKNGKVLKEDTHHACCHKSVKFRLNFLTLGVTSDSVSEVNSLVEILVLGAKRLIKNLLPLLLKKALKQSSGFK